MLPKLKSLFSILKPILAALFSLGFFYSQAVLAQDSTSAGGTATPDVGTMLMNFTQSVPQLMQLVTASAYVMGMYFIYRGLTKLKDYGEQRTQMSSQHDMKGPIIFLCVGTALLYLPTAVATGLSTFWGESNVYAYVPDSNDQWSELYQDSFIIIELIGTISFIRGLVILSHLGGQGGQPGTLSRGVTHIIAGVFCINLVAFINVINATIGLNPIS